MSTGEAVDYERVERANRSLAWLAADKLPVVCQVVAQAVELQRMGPEDSVIWLHHKRPYPVIHGGYLLKGFIVFENRQSLYAQVDHPTGSFAFEIAEQEARLAAVEAITADYQQRIIEQFQRSPSS